MKPRTHILTLILLPTSLMAAALSGTVVSSPGVTVAGTKVMVYNNAGLTVKQDSAVTDASGAYSVTTLNSGFSWLVAGKAGYHNSTAVQRTNSAAAVTGVTITVPINNFSSVVTGRVLRASDSTPFVGAVVALGGGKLDGARLDTTDSAGFYLFDNVGTETEYNVFAFFPGFVAASAGNIAVGWNTTTTMGTLYLMRNVGTISGVVRRADTTSKIIAGAKLIFYINGLKVDSVLSDSLGNYTLELHAGVTYTVKSSAPGYRGNKGTLTRDTTVTINFQATTNLLVYLTPASGTIGGVVRYGGFIDPPTIVNVDSATIYLERRMGTSAGLNTWIVLDSTLSESGFYQFTGLIPATGSNPADPVPVGGTGQGPGGSYRILARHKNWIANYNEVMGLVASTTPTATVVLPFPPNSTVTSNVIFQSPKFELVSLSFQSMSKENLRVSIMGDRLLMDLGISNSIRTVEVYDAKGSLQHSVPVPIGESKAVMSAMYAKGFVFKVR